MASGPLFPPPYRPDSSPYEPPPTGAGEYRWLAPATLQGTADMPPTGHSGRVAMYDLRPLSTGEVLDRIFSLYRSRFMLFAGIAATAAVVRLIVSGAQLGVQQYLLRSTSFSITATATMGLLGVVEWAIFLMAFAVAQAGTMWAVGEVYLGRSASIGESLRAALPHWLRYIGIALWQIGSGIWPALIAALLVGGLFALGSAGSVTAGVLAFFFFLAAIVIGVVLYLHNVLAVPAAVRETLGVRAAMRRSKVLSAGAKGKLFLVLLIVAALYLVMYMVLSVAMFAAMFMHRGMGTGAFATQSGLLVIGLVSLAVNFVGYTLISPVVSIGISLIYFDQRVRKEAFDVAVMLGDESAPGATPAAMPVTFGATHVQAVPMHVAPVVPTYAPIATPQTALNPSEEKLQAVLNGSAAQPHPTAPEPQAHSTEPPVSEPPGGASGI